MLVSILGSDRLDLEEVNIWDNVIKWGIAQNPELEVKKISEWNDDDFISLKIVLEDLLPLIRFCGISSYDFYNRVKPYEKIFNDDFFDDIQQKFVIDDWKSGSSSIIRNDPRPECSLLDLRSLALISSWIDYKKRIYDHNNIPYRFKLLLRGSKDGFSKKDFNRLTRDIKMTVIVMKIEKSGELIGGYNPMSWNIRNRSLTDNYFIKTDKHFIFKISNNSSDNNSNSSNEVDDGGFRHFDALLSRARNSKHSLYHHGKDNTKFREIVFDFCDLKLQNNLDQSDNDPFCSYFCSYNYEKDLRFYDDTTLKLSDYEVYQIEKKKKS